MDIMNLNELTIKQASNKLQKGEISSVDLTKACLDQIKKLDDKIKACLLVCPDEALEAAQKADERIKNGEKKLLLGIPFLAKDNILTKGIRTTAASNMLSNYIAPYDAAIIKNLKKAGAVLIGKTNLDEFAHGASTENSSFGPTHNPWDLTRVPGGSSGGSAAAVAADMCIFAVGTDTGGSIRQPASFCGVTGLKPTYGRASRYGLISMTSSTDVPGPITKTIEDAAIVLEQIAGVCQNDSTTVDFKVSNYAEQIQNKNNLKGFKIGVAKQYLEDNIDYNIQEIIKEAIDDLIKLGAEIKDIDLPHTKYAVPVYYIITPSEISSNLARFDGIRYGYSYPKSDNLQDVYLKNRGKSFGNEVKRRIMIGTYVLSAGYYDAYYMRAQRVRTKIKEELDDELKNLDCILTPTSPHVAFQIGVQNKDPLKMYLEDIFSAPASLAGLPAISVPCGFVDNLPVGMQLIGKRFDENSLFQIGNVYEKNTSLSSKKPKIVQNM